MLDLGTTDFYLAVPSVPEQELERLSTTLFDAWEEFVDVSLGLRDYSLFLQVEEGSVRGMARIGAVLSVLYVGIGNYGDFISGLRTIGEQVSATSGFLTERAKDVFSCPNAKASTRKRGGAIASLQHLFVRVQRGELSPEEAALKAEAVLGEEISNAPGFLEDLTKSLRECPRYHTQDDLPFEDDPYAVELDGAGLPRRPKRPRPPPVLGPVLQFRVEVWRDSKKKRKQTRVLKL